LFKETFEMTKNILITGGSGMLGRLLTKELQSQGHDISILSRNPDQVDHVKAFYWDIEKQEIDKKCLEGIQVIIHLAGEEIASKAWTDNRKRKLISSRVDSIQLLYKTIAEDGVATVESVISASAVGYYGNRDEEILVEQSSRGNGFLAECCDQWEDAVDKGKELGMRVVKFRIGLPLTQKGGVLAPFKMMVRTYTGMSFGSGQQWLPWIHWEGLVGMFVWAIDKEQLDGVFNASPPFPVRNTEFTEELATVLRKPFWPLTLHGFFFKILLGERSELLLMSTNISAHKAQHNGFVFKYPSFKRAIENITAKS